MHITLNIQLVILFVFLTWHYALKCGFISDDHSTIEKRRDIIPDEEKNPKKESYWVKMFNDGVIMYWWTRLMHRTMFGKSSILWHSEVLLVHLVNTFLVYKNIGSLYSEQVGLFTALLWGVNPMHNQVSVWISGRPYSTATMLVLAGWLLKDNVFVFSSLYMLAVITNIQIALIPILLKFAYPDSWQANAYIVLMIIGGAPFIGWKFYKRFTQALVIDRDNFQFKRRRFNTLARIFAYYVWTICCPIRMGWYHQAGFKYNPKWEKFNVWTLLSWIIVFILLKSGFPGWWFLLGIIMNANTHATNSFVEDRYVYFGSIGLATLASLYLKNYPDIFYCIVTFYAVRSYMYSRQMINDEAVYRENWRNHPYSDYAVNNLSYFLIQQARYDEARVMILRALEFNKTNKMLWYNLGITWAAQGGFRNDEEKFKFLRALDCWKMCLQLEPRWQKPAEDIKKLVKLLTDKKVLTSNPSESAGVVVDVPNIKGMTDGEQEQGTQAGAAQISPSGINGQEVHSA